MEKEPDLLQRYALALQLVDDPDLAGDLFMQARTQEGLLHKANRWRGQQGLDPVPMPTLLRPLTPAEAEHGLHLARRAARRRSLHLSGAVVAMALSLLAGTMVSVESAPLDGLSADPAYKQPALEQVEHPKGYPVLIHQVEATPGQVTVWWSATGWQAGNAATTLQPRLQLENSSAKWVEPIGTELATPRRNRTLGRTTFPVFVTAESSALLAFGSGEEEIRVKLHLGRQIEESAQTISVEKILIEGPLTIEVKELVRGPNYTLVRYTARSSLVGAKPPILYSLTTGTRRLSLQGTEAVQEGGLRETLFEALPDDASEIGLAFSPVFVTEPSRVYRMNEAEHYSRNGDEVTVVHDVGEIMAGSAIGFFLGADRVLYPAQTSFQVQGTPSTYRVMLRSDAVPPDVELVSFSLQNLRKVYKLFIPVTLPQ